MITERGCCCCGKLKDVEKSHYFGTIKVSSGIELVLGVCEECMNITFPGRDNYILTPQETEFLFSKIINNELRKIRIKHHCISKKTIDLVDVMIKKGNVNE